jgi:hypothetical protein
MLWLREHLLCTKVPACLHAFMLWCAPPCQLDAKEVARRRAAENKAEAKAAQVRRETRGMKSISALFGKYQCKDGT